MRLSYDRRAQAFRRQCVFMGTTNRVEYLVDDTGNRRWWPVYCSVADIDTDRLLAERDQIWAEAKLIYDEMRIAQPHGTLPLYLVGKASREIAVRTQQSREAQDIVPIWAGKIEQWLDTPIEAAGLEESDAWLEQRPGGRYVRATTCIMEVWEEAYLGDRLPTKPDLNNVANALRKIGWKKNPSPRKFRATGSRCCGTGPPGPLMATEPSSSSQKEYGHVCQTFPTDATVAGLRYHRSRASPSAGVRTDRARRSPCTRKTGRTTALSIVTRLAMPSTLWSPPFRRSRELTCLN